MASKFKQESTRYFVTAECPMKHFGVDSKDDPYLIVIYQGIVVLAHENDFPSDIVKRLVVASMEKGRQSVHEKEQRSLKVVAPSIGDVVCVDAYKVHQQENLLQSGTHTVLPHNIEVAKTLIDKKELTMVVTSVDCVSGCYGRSVTMLVRQGTKVKQMSLPISLLKYA